MYRWFRAGAVALLLAAPAAEAQSARGRVDSVTFRSQALGTTKRYLVYRPPSYDTDPQRRYPVAYYLHGLFGSETDWTERGGLHETLDSLAAAGIPELIVVMPDGDDSWYTTWNFLGDYAGCLRSQPPMRQREAVEQYCVPWPHYDDYIARDLVQHVDSTYRTHAGRAHRGIAGLSMGGYGAVSLALNYRDVFSAAASHSGVLAPLLLEYGGALLLARYASELDTLRTLYGAIWPSLRTAFGPDTSGWLARDPARAARRNTRPFPALYIDVGLEDTFLGQARLLRDVLRELGHPLEYYERRGGHSWAYWRANAAHSVIFLARTLTVR